jgi:hypothetical protein
MIPIPEAAKAEAHPDIFGFQRGPDLISGSNCHLTHGSLADTLGSGDFTKGVPLGMSRKHILLLLI